MAAIRDIYNNRNANVIKGDFYRTIGEGAGIYTIQSEVDKTKHARCKQLLESAFSTAAIKSSEGFIVSNKLGVMNSEQIQSRERGLKQEI
ncbi:hypothetical protein FQN49_001114 [Arthroderma sp. PD_2]|nr:hypothetical protein FQN49_001114 [Arthroderma sp. PD_2]